MTRKRATALAAAAAGLLLAGCSSDADVASRNLSTASEQFEIDRRIVFFNGITDTYLLVVEGRCSIESDTADGQLEVTCKTGQDAFKKHFLGLSDNVTYFVEQQPPANPWPWWFARDSRDGSISVTRSPAGVHVEVAYDVHWAGVTLSVDDAEALAHWILDGGSDGLGSVEVPA